MAKQLKDSLDIDVVALLAEAFASECPAFDGRSFRAVIGATLEDRELKDRVNLIADTLASHLPPDYSAALTVVVAVAHNPRIEGFAAWPLCSFVERHGIAYPDLSLDAMPELTVKWSCEFAIRPFLDRHLDLTRSYLRDWVTDPDESVRRLPSEGTRPLLPWGPRVAALMDNPEIGLEILRELRHDPSETVRRSVGNHLNDISKADPALVVETIGDWLDDDEPVDARMISHALRTLVKRGDSPALALLGYDTDPLLDVGRFSCAPAVVEIGDDIELIADIVSTSDAEQHVVVDFVVHHVHASGSTSPKTFKWSNLRLGAGQTVTIAKRRRIQHASTRRYHAGRHRVDLQISGEVVASTHFDLMLD